VTLRPRLSDGLALFSSSRLAHLRAMTGYAIVNGFPHRILSTFWRAGSACGKLCGAGWEICENQQDRANLEVLGAALASSGLRGRLSSYRAGCPTCLELYFGTFFRHLREL